MAEVLLIRHGQSANNANEEHLRVPDPELTETGQRQAEATAAKLATLAIDGLYCSPFTRSLQTMLPIAKQLTKPAVRIRCDLFELGGCYSGYKVGEKRGEPGLGRSQLSSLYPGWEIDDLIGESGWWGRDYETNEQATLRAQQVTHWLTSEIAPQGGRHALVIHADFKRLLIEAMLTAFGGTGLIQSQVDAPLFNTGISILAFNEGQWQLRQFNCTAHLPSHCIT